MKLTCVTAVLNAVRTGNRERLIRCVRSVASLRSDCEHLIYDAASDDGTVQVLRELEAVTPNLTVVSEPDTGLYVALNKGVRDAKGEWFLVLGCDDYIVDPQALDGLLARMPVADLVASPTYCDRGKGLEKGYWKRRHLLTGMPYCHQGVLMRTAAIREFGGFDEEYRMAGDYDLVLKFHLNRRRIVFAHRPFSVFTAVRTMASQRTETVNAADAVIRNFKLEGRDAEVFRRELQLPWGFLLRHLVHRDPTIRLASCSMIARKILKGRRKEAGW